MVKCVSYETPQSFSVLHLPITLSFSLMLAPNIVLPTTFLNALDEYPFLMLTCRSKTAGDFAN
jgi:hypothetical protein